MCWSGEASTALATVGFASTAYVAYKGEAKAVWIPLAYFSLMEALQALTYPVINQCGLPRNQLLTLLGNLHIVFQPFFINMVSLHFIPARIRRTISPYVYGTCMIGVVLLLLRIYPFEWAGTCQIGIEPLCGERLCSVSGTWHIAWEVPSNGMAWTMLGYFIPAFLLPILYGSWRCTLYHIAAGPLLALTLTDNINEWPAVWCLMSIGLILLVAKTPVRKWLYVHKWWFWGNDLRTEPKMERMQQINPSTPTDIQKPHLQKESFLAHKKPDIIEHQGAGWHHPAAGNPGLEPIEYERKSGTDG